ncbi:MAG: antitoxin CptB [Candidatus Midichloriaceae bacterium]|jgi:antitoxin CptB
MNITDIKRKVLYRSLHRGCKELDIILGNFSKASLEDLDFEETIQYEALLDLPDNDIYDWVTEKKEVPEQYKSTLLDRVIEFQRNFTGRDA